VNTGLASGIAGEHNAAELAFTGVEIIAHQPLRLDDISFGWRRILLVLGCPTRDCPYHVAWLAYPLSCRAGAATIRRRSDHRVHSCRRGKPGSRSQSRVALMRANPFRSKCQTDLAGAGAAWSQ